MLYRRWLRFDPVAVAQVYRMAAEDIGCSLAEAAEAPSYDAYLAGAQAAGGRALHVVYINTSLRTKAEAHAHVPTITCTSSNVVQTVLQAFAQVRGAASAIRMEGVRRAGRWVEGGRAHPE